MWLRKSPEQIRGIERRTRFNPIFALIMAVFAAALMTLGRSWGYGGYLLPPLPPKPLWQTLHLFPFFFAAMFLVFYLPQILRRRVKYPDRDAMICDQCHDVRDYTVDRQCRCGGRLEPLRHWMWVPHHSDPPDPDLTMSRLRYRYSKRGDLLTGPDDASDRIV
jgi:hypothetical protein